MKFGIAKVNKFLTRRVLVFIIASILFAGLLVMLPDNVAWEPRATIAVMIFGVVLWAFEPIPLGMTSVLTLVLLLLLNAVPKETVLSGFGSSAVFLIIAGMMIARGVDATPLMKRVTYFLLAKWGNTPRGIFIGLFLLMQIQAFFIPATAVRVSLMLPIVITTIQLVGAKKGSNFAKLMMVGTAYAGNVSGTAILTAAVGNILTIEMLQTYTGETLSYFAWFLYTFPIWVLLVIVIPFILLKIYPPETYVFDELQQEMKKRQHELGKLGKNEKKCLCILSFIVLLWMTEPLHGYHPTVPALLAVVLITFPRIGFAHWQDVVKINFNLVLLIGATLSLGYALIESGTIDMLSEVFTADVFLWLFSNAWIALLLIVIITQIYHLAITNVSTAVVTLLPIVIGISTQVGLDPLVMSLAVSITVLYGYVLVVETMPNVLAHGTGFIEQRDFFIPGIWATGATTVITLVVIFTWWNWLGFWPK